MDFSPTEEQQLVLEAVRGLAARLRARAGAWDAEDLIDPEGRASVTELGLGGLFIDESLGGAGLGPVAGLQVLEAIGEASGGLGLRLSAHVAAGIPLLAAAGAAPEHLAEVIADPGWLAMALGVDGGAEGLSGTVRWVAGARDASTFVVLTVNGGVFLVDRDASGLHVEPTSAMGMRGAGLGHLRLEGVRPKQEVGSVDAEAATELDALGRLAVASVGVGVGRAALVQARDYALERKQFGRPISEFQAVQWMIADAATELDAAGLLIARASLARPEPDASGAMGALVLAAEAAQKAAYNAIQVHGGNGFVREYPVERLFRDTRWLGMAFGGRDAARVALGRALLS